MFQIFNRFTGTAVLKRPKEPMQFHNYGDALKWLRDNKIDPTLYEVRKVED
jgi:hypothetical protein